MPLTLFDPLVYKRKAIFVVCVTNVATLHIYTRTNDKRFNQIKDKSVNKENVRSEVGGKALII